MTVTKSYRCTDRDIEKHSEVAMEAISLSLCAYARARRTDRRAPLGSCCACIPFPLAAPPAPPCSPPSPARAVYFLQQGGLLGGRGITARWASLGGRASGCVAACLTSAHRGPSQRGSCPRPRCAFSLPLRAATAASSGAVPPTGALRGLHPAARRPGSPFAPLAPWRQLRCRGVVF